ncbi:hypothetical protein BDZ89DRAFT_309417 [Hymenopellis radicata]|nr:hypothetical protein BDZ89DRAFT_309417 [Hymenopellis radicata]
MSVLWPQQLAFSAVCAMVWLKCGCWSQGMDHTRVRLQVFPWSPKNSQTQRPRIINITLNTFLWRISTQTTARRRYFSLSRRSFTASCAVPVYLSVSYLALISSVHFPQAPACQDHYTALL